MSTASEQKAKKEFEANLWAKVRELVERAELTATDHAGRCQCFADLKAAAWEVKRAYAELAILPAESEDDS